MKIQLILAFLSYTVLMTSGQYCIMRDAVKPTYLEKKFNNINEQVFPKSLRIALTLSRLQGNLWYSIDQNLHQLIIRFNDNHIIKPELKIEFNGLIFQSYFNELCGCKTCTSSLLMLSIDINDNNKSIRLRCNNYEAKVFNYTHSSKIMPGYPNPYGTTKPNTNTPNKAHVNLGNTPLDSNYNLLHNPFQLEGIIHEIVINNEKITDWSTHGDVQYFTDQNNNEICKNVSNVVQSKEGEATNSKNVTDQINNEINKNVSNVVESKEGEATNSKNGLSYLRPIYWMLVFLVIMVILVIPMMLTIVMFLLKRQQHVTDEENIEMNGPNSQSCQSLPGTDHCHKYSQVDTTETVTV